MRIALLAFAVSLIAGQAAGDPIFPTMIQGRYGLAVITAQVAVDADGVPESQPTGSVGILRVDLADPVLLVCEDVPGGLGETVPVQVEVPVIGDRAELRAIAYSSPGCQGKESERSADGAYVFFLPPGPPSLSQQ